ncbi:MAG: NADH-quinone oxidoreductase subunit J, partial [Armatimonadota bacterium]|nr:NADH-quinone oxidoreductase subunit J [Armatimonadota bacterium]
MTISLPELPTLSQIAFLLIATIIVCSAVLVVTLRNIFHSLLFLVLTFLGVAGVFLLLAADFLAAVQVLIYVGAIIVLLLFALMLTHRVMSADVTQTAGQWVLAVPISVGLLTLMFQIFV